jgi:peptidoglycan lytic transglycosylase B
MVRILPALIVLAASVLVGAQQPPTETVEPRPPFDEWLNGVKAEAVSRGIRQEVVDEALGGVEHLEVVVERDQNQAEFQLSVDDYLKRRLTPSLIRRARGLRADHRDVLRTVSAEYGVPAEILIAVWGLESNFGRFSGVRPTIPTIATLAYEPRRSAFFRAELFSALDIVNRGDIDLSGMKGSWAGAMGQTQFMPSTYLQYAVDFDKDGRRDIWRSLPDVFASMANYLRDHGWTPGRAWGREVRVPEETAAIATAAPPRDAGCLAVRNMSQPLPLDKWQELGVRSVTGARLPAAEVDASLVQAGRRSFLVYANYEALLAYNCAHTYALSVGLLADRLGPAKARAAARTAEKPATRSKSAKPVKGRAIAR